MPTLEGMSVTQEKLRPQTAPTPADDPRTDRVQRVLAEIRADAQKDPATYLRDTIVPEGGE